MWTSADVDRDVIWIHHIQDQPSSVEAHVSIRLSRTEALNLAEAIYRDAHTISAVKMVDDPRPI